MTNPCSLIALLTAALLLASCDKPPEALPVPKEINRVVSMAPSLTECTFSIGAGDRVVGVTTFCGFPEKATRLPRIGGYTDANYEKIYTLKPDLALLLDEHIVAADRLRELGIPHIRLDTSTIPAIFQTLESLGMLIGEQAQTERTIADLKKRMAEIQTNTANTPKRKVLISIGRNMGSGGLTDVYVAGKNTLYNEMLELIGAENVYAGKLDYAKMSHEAIMQLAPDVIIDLIPDLETSLKMTPDEVRKEWDILKNVPAVRNGEVHVFGGDYVCVPGPRFILVLEDIARATHPDLFPEVP